MLQRLDRLYERASNNRQGIFLLLSAIAIYFDTLLADRRKKRNLFWNTTLLKTIHGHSAECWPQRSMQDKEVGRKMIH